MSVEEEFKKFQEIRHSGKINMLDIEQGCLSTGLNKDRYTYILNNYSRLCNKYKQYLQ